MPSIHGLRRGCSIGALLLVAACGGSSPAGSGGGSEDSGVATTGTAADSSTGGVGATGSGTSGGPADGTSSSGTTGHGGDGPKYDIGVIPDSPKQECGGADGGGGGGGNGDPQLSYIWIANSAQGTISKIDTQTIVEEGRYMARPANGDPSRTSVNLNGDVAVANRNGGVSKFWADKDNCQDSNGTPGIQTSSGAADILPWGQDDCLAWHLPLVCNSNRPVAWTRGEWDPSTCSYVDAKLWTVCNNSVHLIDGETGVIEQTVATPNANAFVYGGAADADGNFFGIDTTNSRLFRVDAQDYSVLNWGFPSSGAYGITVDSEGRPWVSGGGTVSRFNLDDATWTSSGGGGGIGGCMTDGATTIWHSNPSGLLLGFDTESLAVVNMIQLPEYVHGVSVDFYGYVWGVSFAGNNAYRADPETLEVQQYAGLTGAYTYSDMTGFALVNAGGGGVPPS